MDRHGRVRKHSYSGVLNGYDGGKERVAQLWVAPLFKVWMKVGHVMGWINTRIILGILYFGLITPMGVIMRMFGWDSMRRALSRDAESYRVVRQARPRNHMTRQF